MSMEYNRAFAGCPKCWHEERGEQVTNELVWGFAFSRGNVAFCPECGYEVAQNDLPDICFSPDRESINIDAFNMWLTTQAGAK